MRLRFAPSPTGHLHVGNARTALVNWLLARGRGGTFVLRIEDTDRERSTVESEAAILDDLTWLGLTWDEGPDVGGPYGPYRQTERLPLYAEHAQRLLTGGRAYSCFCSAETLEAQRQAQLAEGRPPKYAGTCRALDPAAAARRRAAGEPAAIRFHVPARGDVTFHDAVRGPVTFHTDVIGDPIIVRSDGMPAYNFAVVVDDALMHITHVIRGEDHISNTPRQVLLYEAFGWTPPRFAHLSLVMGPDHAPLSKRHGATSVAEFRAKGYLPEALVNYLALIGWSPGGDDELLPLDELARRFSLEHVAHSAGVFDEQKLTWANRHYLKTADPQRLVRLALPFLRDAGQVVGPTSAAARAWLEFVVPRVAASVDRLSEIPDRLKQVFVWRRPLAELDEEPAPAVILAFAEELERSPRLTTREAFRELVGRVRERTGQKGTALLHPIRLAVTAEVEGPELDLLVPAIERAAELPLDSGLAHVAGCRERATWIASVLKGRS
jgi:glutamyl-tRNA synthetase/nondiscriminating glutamyl-tRNA synthetase